MSQRSHAGIPIHDPRYSIYPSWSYVQESAPDTGFGTQPDVTYRGDVYAPNSTYEQDQPMLPVATSSSNVLRNTSSPPQGAITNEDFSKERSQEYNGNQRQVLRPHNRLLGHHQNERSQMGRHGHIEAMVDADAQNSAESSHKHQVLSGAYVPSRREDSSMRIRESLKASGKQPALTMGRSAAEPTTYTPPAQVCITQASWPTSTSQPRDIGRVVYHDVADKNKRYRFVCDRVECLLSESMGRVQDSKRHNIAFHEGVLLECPHDGCSKRLARPDKMKEHYEKKHGVIGGDMPETLQALGNFQGEELMLDEGH
ncbi:hypothetical protein DE146DRAFT_129922 [Phaeosphaeria sp. MPI-PUGE-AT-0046c]|nr:hypothetical protein DE146DRAFT_129922 [Phaeosphaeria sp. MPI-PUGE-AT-0046c]